MTIRDRIPVDVEPLDDERVARIERAVITALPARPARTIPWRAIVPVAVAAAAVAALVLTRAPKREPAAEPAPPMEVAADDHGARVDLGDAIIVAGPGARFQVTRPDGGVDIALEIGRIELDVAKRGGRPPLTVHADDVEVVVVGTKFAVERDPEVSVEVTEGAVRVRRGSDTVTVAAGEAWTDGTKVAMADLAPAPDVEPELHDRTGSAPEQPDSTTGSSKHAPKHKDRDKDKTAIKPVAVDPEDELRAAIRAQAIAKASGETASATLYNKGVDENGSRTAMRTLDQYLLQFPKGPELDDARWLRLRILCLKSIDKACRSAAHTYLSGKGEASKTRVAQRIINFH